MKDINNMEINFVVLKNKMTLHNSDNFPLKLHTLGVLEVPENFPGRVNLYPYGFIEKIAFIE